MIARLALVLLLATLVGCGGRTLIVDRPDQATFDGRTYLGLVPTAVKIADGAAAPIGTAASVYGQVTDTTVFGLEGVDPTDAVAMRLADGTFMAFIAESSDGRTPLLSAVPGMCVYAVSEPGC